MTDRGAEFGKYGERVLRFPDGIVSVVIPPDAHGPSSGERASSLNACFLYSPNNRDRRMKAFWNAAPLLAPFASLSKFLGPPQRIEVSFVEGTGAEATASFDREGTEIDRLGRWLLANGFEGDRANGWLRKPKTGPRALVELSRDMTTARDNVVLKVVELPP